MNDKARWREDSGMADWLTKWPTPAIRAFVVIIFPLVPVLMFVFKLWEMVAGNPFGSRGLFAEIAESYVELPALWRTAALPRRGDTTPVNRKTSPTDKPRS
jgi:hypothetical protein